MATESQILDGDPALTDNSAAMLVHVASTSREQLEVLLPNLVELNLSLPGESLIVATPDAFTAESFPGLRIIPSQPATPSWSLAASDFANAHQLAIKCGARSILMLGPEPASLRPSALFGLASAVLSSNTDLILPRYDLPSRSGMVNSAILYPLTRALFASRTRFPLAIDLGLSLRMLERLATAARRFPPANQPEVLLWPVGEAAVAGFAVSAVDSGPRSLPQPADPDINAILARITGSLFADIDAKATFWQRARALPPARMPIAQTPSTDGLPDIAPLLDAFRLGHSNLREIWSLVLPPNSLLGLKRLSATDAAAFRLPDDLWARIVYDFLLAYRLRTINRGHLLGALIPLYLAWVASHINVTVSGINAERHIEEVGAAFEAEKPYLLSRWRWPDRFNP